MDGGRGKAQPWAWGLLLDDEGGSGRKRIAPLDEARHLCGICSFAEKAGGISLSEYGVYSIYWIDSVLFFNLLNLHKGMTKKRRKTRKNRKQLFPMNNISLKKVLFSEKNIFLMRNWQKLDAKNCLFYTKHQGEEREKQSAKIGIQINRMRKTVRKPWKIKKFAFSMKGVWCIFNKHVRERKRFENWTENGRGLTDS